MADNLVTEIVEELVPDLIVKPLPPFLNSFYLLADENGVLITDENGVFITVRS